MPGPAAAMELTATEERHLIVRLIRSLRASARLPKPAALPRIKRARRTRRCGVVPARTQAVKWRYASLEELAQALHAFGRRYSTLGQPFAWCFTRQDLERRLREPLLQPEPVTLATAA